MSYEKRELIWVNEEFAKKYNEMVGEANKNDERLKALDDYLLTVSESARKDFRAQLDNLEEDAAMFKGLMLSVKQAFEKAKNEQLGASYELWEKFETEIPSVTKKTEQIISELQPLKKELTEINELLSKISTYQFEQLIECIQKASNLYSTEKKMFNFLIENYKPEFE